MLGDVNPTLFQNNDKNIYFFEMMLRKKGRNLSEKQRKNKEEITFQLALYLFKMKLCKKGPLVKNKEKIKKKLLFS